MLSPLALAVIVIVLPHASLPVDDVPNAKATLVGERSSCSGEAVTDVQLGDVAAACVVNPDCPDSNDGSAVVCMPNLTTVSFTLLFARLFVTRMLALPLFATAHAEPPPSASVTVRVFCVVTTAVPWPLLSAAQSLKPVPNCTDVALLLLYIVVDAMIVTWLVAASAPVADTVKRKTMKPGDVPAVATPGTPNTQAATVAPPVEEYPRPSADVSSSNVCGNALPAAGFALKLSITVTIAATPVPRRQLLLLSASVTTSLVSELADAELSHATKPPSKRTLVVVAAAYIACCAVIVIVDPATIEPREALVNANCTLSGELLAFAEPANADTHPGCVVSPVVYAV